ncbi:MAG: hypothetical protein AAGC54_02115, partial [Cyanobacteria bacterium P01_F01_bin.4]
MQKHNQAQHDAFQDIASHVDQAKPAVFFVDAPAGTGKTFLVQTLLAHVRAQRRIALAVASSGIAATLLPGGRTALSRFRLPIDPTATSTCRISRAKNDQI